MTSFSRRFGPENSETRAMLLDTAEKLLLDQGYAAVTSRALAKSAGLSPQIFYYYFKTMDQLFGELFARISAYYLSAIAAAKTAGQPILAIWNLSSDPSRANLIAEFVALSNHHPGLQQRIAAFGRDYLACQTAIIAAEFARLGIDPLRWPPKYVAACLENLARGSAFSKNFHIPEHEEAREFVATRLLDLFASLARD